MAKILWQKLKYPENEKSFFVIFKGLSMKQIKPLIVKICVSFLFWKKSDKFLTFNSVQVPNFEISASL